MDGWMGRWMIPGKRLSIDRIRRGQPAHTAPHRSMVLEKNALLGCPNLLIYVVAFQQMAALRAERKGGRHMS
eukprot:350554-Chlamydomonas_euryale.AAC.1